MPGGPRAEMLRLISGFWSSRALFAAARLGLPDQFDDGAARTAGELAAATGTHPGALYRLLRALAGAGVFAEEEGGRFRLTPLGETLRSEAPGSLRALAIVELGLDHYQAWEHLLYSLRTGKVAFEHRFGMNARDYYSRHVENGRLFDEATAGAAAAVGAELLAAVDLSPFRTIVDVGGGRGHLLASLLAHHAGTRGVLLELPAATSGAETLLEHAGVRNRCDVVAGDFFTAMPEGGDLYLLRRILHDCDDERAAALLAVCRRAIRPGGRLLVVEELVEAGEGSALCKWTDLVALVMTGGRERTEAEYRALLAAGGFATHRVAPLPCGWHVLDARPS